MALSACAPREQPAEVEGIYFTTVNHIGRNGTHYTKVSHKPQVYYYEGGDSYRLVFELPGSGPYEMEIWGDKLYYGLSKARHGNSNIELYCVDLQTGSEVLCTMIPGHELRRVVADDSGIYMLTAEGDECCIYKLKYGSLTEIVRKKYISAEGFSVGGGYVFYIEEDGTLIGMNPDNFKTKLIAESVSPVAHTEYDAGRVYVSFTHCFSYPLKRGKAFLETPEGSLEKFPIPSDMSLSTGVTVVCDGRIYHKEKGTDGDVLKVRELGSDKQLTYTFGFDIGFYSLEDIINFGSRGFIVNDAQHSSGGLQELNRYYYCSYDHDAEITALSLS